MQKNNAYVQKFDLGLLLVPVLRLSMHSSVTFNLVA